MRRRPRSAADRAGARSPVARGARTAAVGQSGSSHPLTGKTKFLRKEAIAHLVRAVAGVSGHSSFVMIGTGAVIAQLKHVPLDLMRTREIDIYPQGVPDAEDIATLIDGTLGEGSPFDETFGYYAQASESERPACPTVGRSGPSPSTRLVSLESSAFVRRSTTSRFPSSAPGAKRTGLGSWWDQHGRPEPRSHEGAQPRDLQSQRPDIAEIDRRISSAEESAGRQRGPTLER